MEWELIKSASTKREKLFRMKVPEGWLLRSATCIVRRLMDSGRQNISTSESLLFVADSGDSWEVDSELNWEYISRKQKDFFGALIDKTFRLRVPQGWIVKTQTMNRASSSTGTIISEDMVFISDTKLKWSIK